MILNILGINLLVQVSCFLFCIYCIRNYMQFIRLNQTYDLHLDRIFNEDMSDHVRRHQGWKPDPLTEAISDLDHLKDEVSTLSKKVSEECVSKYEFQPIQRVVYGMVAVILTTALLSLLVLIWKGTKP